MLGHGTSGVEGIVAKRLDPDLPAGGPGLAQAYRPEGLACPTSGSGEAGARVGTAFTSVNHRNLPRQPEVPVT